MQIEFNNVKFKCPHCGFENNYHRQVLYRNETYELVNCDDEEGGCGTQIVLRFKIDLSLTTEAFKIQGIEGDAKAIQTAKERRWATQRAINADKKAEGK